MKEGPCIARPRGGNKRTRFPPGPRFFPNTNLLLGQILALGLAKLAVTGDAENLLHRRNVLLNVDLRTWGSVCIGGGGLYV